MAARASRDIKHMQAALGQVLGDDEVDEGETPAELSAKAMQQLRTTQSLLNDKNDAMDRLHRELAAVQHENVRLAGAVEEERTAARSAAQLRSSLAQQHDVEVLRRQKLEAGLRHARLMFLQRLHAEADGLLLARYYGMFECLSSLTGTDDDL
eukprot:TRINITY_DN27625_c0_g1_i1.p1 TRINITY_DN27625_c0_g1~~TRINITY_DN27625_c0_g1_i1.p1  ORF type:complete len:176 (+),score=63.46 TRINITY_DN27625_c0_g1_i1:70-528(+)